jgi:hypothetical protein
MVIESHVIPDCMNKFVHDSRDYWETYILGGDSILEETYGPSHPQVKYAIKMDPKHSLKHHICRECDSNKLGVLVESVICKSLMNTILSEQNRLKTTGESSQITLFQFNSNTYRIFILSIIWRLNLRHFRDTGEFVLPPAVMEDLRLIIYTYLYKNTSIFKYKYPFIVFCSNIPQRNIINVKGINKFELHNYSSVNIIQTSPELFFLGPLCVFLALGKPFKNILNTFPFEIESLVNHTNFSQARQNILHFIKDESWKQNNLLFAKTLANTLYMDMCNRLSEIKSITPKAAEMALIYEKNKIQHDSPHLNADEHNLEVLKLAFERLTQNLNPN